MNITAFSKKRSNSFDVQQSHCIKKVKKNSNDKINKVIKIDKINKKNKTIINKNKKKEIINKKINKKIINDSNQSIDIQNDKLNIIDIFFQNINTIKNNKKSNSKLDNEFEELYQSDNKAFFSGLQYFKTLNDNDKLEYIDKLKKINKLDLLDKRPNYMKILDMNISETNKSLILQRISILEKNNSYIDNIKLINWVKKIMKVPFGNYIQPPVKKTDSTKNIINYLNNSRKHLNNNIFGHENTKNQIIKILAHTISNPDEGGSVFGIQGPPGVGKTALIKDGIANALKRPFSFISLGGASNACFLEGHEYTYEGSNHGRIIEILQEAKCMNPVIYFDELDKVSETPRGEEIINILMHITDSTQNSNFNDKYFGGIEFDLSKAIIIFSFNDEEKISKILRDRIKIIRVKGYKIVDKLIITKNYIIPKLIKQIGLEYDKIIFPDDILEFLIDNYTYEGGVRKIKELLNDILLEINLRKLEKTNILDKKIKFPIHITKKLIEDDLLKKKNKIYHQLINNKSLVGLVNGLWANHYGVGGIIPIESCWIPSRDKLGLILTGMQGDVMKESMNVAKSVAWKILPLNIKTNLTNNWKTNYDWGIHIHAPDGASPKDGPSAGGAITICLISLFSNIKINNEISMTGEINLRGQITKIGGLEEKIFGAIKAKCKLVLCPRENQTDLNEIKEKFPTIFNENFNVKLVDNIWDILNEVTDEKINWIKFN